jgi:CHASE3 domain sensor protein
MIRKKQLKLMSDNPETDTTADDIETNIQVKVTKLPDVFGKTEDD